MSRAYFRQVQKSSTHKFSIPDQVEEELNEETENEDGKNEMENLFRKQKRITQEDNKIINIKPTEKLVSRESSPNNNKP